MSGSSRSEPQKNDVRRPAKIHIGTSGWHYKHWKGPFYPADLSPAKMLSWYVERFDTVEINNSFYRLPAESALALWCRLAPASFCFAVKASRYITHNRKLKDPQNGIERFLTSIGKLGPRLGPILFQLPPAWKVNVERLDEFLSRLPRGHRYAFEFRNPTWNVPEIYEVLDRHNAAYCIYELAGFHSPIQITADFTYVRLHGPGNKYQGDYSEQTLRRWAERMEGWRNELRHIFVYFDNDQAGFAPKNAWQLKKQVAESGRNRAA